jgi:hypothetical protein
LPLQPTNTTSTPRTSKLSVRMGRSFSLKSAPGHK